MQGVRQWTYIQGGLMKAKDGIIDLLNRVLTENLTAIN